LEKRYINNDPTQYTPALIIELNPILILDMTLYIENAENPDCNNLQLKPHCKENDLALLVGHGISLIDDHIKTKKITDINGNLIVTPFPLFQYYNFYNDPFGTPPERAGEEIIY